MQWIIILFNHNCLHAIIQLEKFYIMISFLISDLPMQRSFFPMNLFSFQQKKKVSIINPGLKRWKIFSIKIKKSGLLLQLDMFQLLLNPFYKKQYGKIRKKRLEHKLTQEKIQKFISIFQSLVVCWMNMIDRLKILKIKYHQSQLTLRKILEMKL